MTHTISTARNYSDVFERNMTKILARVTPLAEVTMDLDGYTPERRDAVIAFVEDRGMRASFDGRFLLIRWPL